MTARQQREQFWVNNYTLSGLAAQFETFDTSHATTVNIRGWNQGTATDNLNVYGYYAVPAIYPKLVQREEQFTSGVFCWPLAKALFIGPDQWLGATYNAANGVATEILHGTNGVVSGPLALGATGPLYPGRNAEYYYMLSPTNAFTIAGVNNARLALKNNFPFGVIFAAFFTAGGEVFLDANGPITEYTGMVYDLANQRLTWQDSLGHVASSPVGSYPANVWCSVAVFWNAGTFTFYRNGVSVGTAALPVTAYAAVAGSSYFNRQGSNYIAHMSFYYNGTQLNQQMAQRHYEAQFFNYKVISGLYGISAASFVAGALTINRATSPGMPDSIGVSPDNANGVWYVDVQITSDV